MRTYKYTIVERTVHLKTSSIDYYTVTVLSKCENETSFTPIHIKSFNKQYTNALKDSISHLSQISKEYS
jgi:hypothetical protein